MFFETMLWVMVAGTFLLVAHLVFRDRPRRAALLLLCAAGQVTGVVGGLLRMDMIGDLGVRFAGADATARDVIEASFVQVASMVNAYSHAASLIQAIGFVAAASVFCALPGFPRLVSRWMYLSGTLPLL